MKAPLSFKIILFPPLFISKCHSAPFHQLGKTSRTFIFRVSCQFCLVNKPAGTSGAINAAPSMPPLFRDGVYHYPDGWTEKSCIFRIVLREQLLEISSLETGYWQQVLLLWHEVLHRGPILPLIKLVGNMPFFSSEVNRISVANQG